MTRYFDTNTEIDALPTPVAGRDEYRDRRNPALVLRVSASGTKSFCVARKVNGKFKRVTLGTYKRKGDAHPRMTLERARLASRRADGDLAEGIDPTAVKREKRKRGRLLSEVLGDYLRSNTKLKESTRSEYTRVLREFCEDWSDRPLTELTREQIKQRHAKHGKERSEARANGAVRVLRALFYFADISPNPAANPKRKGAGGAFMFDEKRKRTRITAKQMPAWWSAASGLSPRRSDSGAATASDLLLFLLLTGLRAGEACSLAWENVDVAEGVITIADTKNRDPHVLPLGKMLAAMIVRRSESRSTQYVFGGTQPYSYNTLRGWFDTVAEQSGVRVTPHDLRRTFASVAESLDISSFAVKRLLNHRTGRADVTDGYIIVDPERLRGAMQRIEDEMITLSVAKKGEPDGR